MTIFRLSQFKKMVIFFWTISAKKVTNPEKHFILCGTSNHLILNISLKLVSDGHISLKAELKEGDLFLAISEKALGSGTKHS
jgi:hypothetical protein